MKILNKLLKTRKQRLTAWGITLAVLAASVAGELISDRRTVTLNTMGVVSHLGEVQKHVTPTLHKWLTDNDSMLQEQLWSCEIEHPDPLHKASVYLLQGDTVCYWSGNELHQDITPYLLRHQPTIVDIEGKQLLIINRHNRQGRIASLVLPLLDTAFAQHYQFPEEYEIRFFHDPAVDTLSGTLHAPPPANAVKVEFAGASFYVSVLQIRPHIQIYDITGWAAMMALIILISYSMARATKIQNAQLMWLVTLLIMVGIRVTMTVVPINIFSGEALTQYFTGYKEYLFSPFNLLVSAIFTLATGFHKYTIRRKLALRTATLSSLQRILITLLTITMRSALLIYFHWAFIENIYNPLINVDLFRLFSTTPSGLLIYISIGIYMVARLFQTDLNQLGVSNREHWMQIGLGVVVLSVMIIPMIGHLHGTWPLLIIYSALFRSLSLLSKRVKMSTLFTMSVAITALYFTTLVMTESRTARYLMARDYLEMIDKNQTNPAFQEPPQYEPYSYAIINKFHLRIKSNSQIPLQDLLSIVDRDTLVREGTYTHIITPQANQTIIISYQDIRFKDWVAMLSYQFLIFFVLGLVIFRTLGLRDVSDRFTTRSLTFKLQAMIMSIVAMIMVMVTILSIQYSLNNAAFSQMQTINNKLRIMLTNINLYEVDHPLKADLLEEWYSHIGRSLGYNVALYDTRGILIAPHPDSPKTTRYRLESGAVSALKHHAKPFYTMRDGESTLTVILPAYHGQTLIGYLDTRFIDPSGKTLIYPVMEDIFNLFMVIFVVSMIFSLMLNRVVTQPLENLRKAMSNVGLMRKIEIRNPGSMDSEIRQLVIQYNQMIDYLEQSYADLARSEREGAWQEMARRVAHEIRNPLTPMKLKVQMLQRARSEGRTCADIKLDETLVLLNEQIDIITRIVEEFRDFARMRSAAPSIVNLCTLTRDVTALYDSYERVTITFENLCSEAVWVYADSSQLNRVIGNLCKNAAEALVDSKTVQPTVKISLRKIDGIARIKITDNGPGIPPEIVGRIFEPNFTTKAGGSGLGLVISRQIIRNIGGEITFHSSPEGQQGGTTFTIDLPISYAPPNLGKIDDL